MVNWSYYNESGDKINVSGKELKALAERGAITPETKIENPDGKTAPAKRVKGLLFATPESIPSEQTVPELVQPAETETVDTSVPNETDINKRYRSGRTRLHKAAEKNDVESITALIIAGADVNIHDTKNSATPLHWAASNNSIEAIAVLVKAGADVNVKNIDGNTPLHLAAHNDDDEAIIALVKAGANVNAKDKDGDTPLHLAPNNDANKAIIALVKMGANVNAKNKDGITPLEVANDANFHKAADILKKAGAILSVSDIETANDDLTLTTLHDAACVNNPTAIVRLLKAGADVNEKLEPEKFSPLHFAALADATEAVAVLLKSGADVNARQRYDATPLHCAALKNSTATAQMLISAGADVNAKNINGGTPLHIANTEKSHEVADILKKAGATCISIAPFVVMVIYGIIAAFVGNSFFAGLHDATEVHAVDWFLFGAIRFSSWVLIIGGVVLGVYCYVRQKQDTLYVVCWWVAVAPPIILITMGIMGAFDLALAGLGLLGILILFPWVLGAFAVLVKVFMELFSQKPSGDGKP